MGLDQPNDFEDIRELERKEVGGVVLFKLPDLFWKYPEQDKVFWFGDQKFYKGYMYIEDLLLVTDIHTEPWVTLYSDKARLKLIAKDYLPVPFAMHRAAPMTSLKGGYYLHLLHYNLTHSFERLSKTINDYMQRVYPELLKISDEEAWILKSFDDKARDIIGEKRVEILRTEASMVTLRLGLPSNKYNRE